MGKAITAGQMATHIETLCIEHGIELRFYKGGGRAWKKPRRIDIRPVKGVTTYFVALHEIGHIVGRGRSARKLEVEANAWAWALSHAVRPPTVRVCNSIGEALRSYLYAGRRNRGLRQGMIEPPEGHCFWELANPPWLVQYRGRVRKGNS